MSAGKWEFASASIIDEYKMYGTYNPDNTPNTSDVHFFVKNASTDVTPPILTALTIEQQGETLKAGDILTLHVSITEESDIVSCQIVFRNATTGATKNIASSFSNRADGQYSYQYTISSDMSAGKWEFASASVIDEYKMYGTYNPDKTPNTSDVHFFVEN